MSSARHTAKHRAKRIAEYGSRAWQLHSEYGIPLEEAARLLAAMPAACPICGNIEAKLVYDHDHRTGKFRGWLCQLCNRGIGHFADDPDRLEAAATYVRRTK